MAEKAAFLHLNTQATDQRMYIPRTKGRDAENLNWDRNGVVGSIPSLLKRFFFF